jgi:hypothetical protein
MSYTGRLNKKRRKSALNVRRFNGASNTVVVPIDCFKTAEVMQRQMNRQHDCALYIQVLEWKNRVKPRKPQDRMSVDQDSNPGRLEYGANGSPQPRNAQHSSSWLTV